MRLGTLTENPGNDEARTWRASIQADFYRKRPAYRLSSRTEALRNSRLRSA